MMKAYTGYARNEQDYRGTRAGLFGIPQDCYRTKQALRGHVQKKEHVYFHFEPVPQDGLKNGAIN
jgi:hypothetical protein